MWDNLSTIIAIKYNFKARRTRIAIFKRIMNGFEIELTSIKWLINGLNKPVYLVYYIRIIQDDRQD